MNSQHYIGEELELFERAKNWKKYYFSFLKDYLYGHILEVGAGLGTTTLSICDGSQEFWLCLEPDKSMANKIQVDIQKGVLPKCCSIFSGTIGELKKNILFDSILYIDVLEHIQKDQEELKETIKHLKKGGTLIILSPAHSFLYSPFDKAVGHYRRYTKQSLSKITPSALECIDLFYLDSVGMLASLANKLFLSSSIPTMKQVDFWNGTLVPLSIFLDPLFGYSLGKTVLGIWKLKN